jgi:uracil phosphoribosyltransferase
MENEIVLTAQDLEGLLTPEDTADIQRMEASYSQAMESFKLLSASPNENTSAREKEKIIVLYNSMGKMLQEVTGKFNRIKVYPFETPTLLHAEASRLIAKLRDERTGHDEFVYYIQRAYELLFNLAFGVTSSSQKHHLIVKTPVTQPVQNYAVHKIPDVDDKIENSVMCVMLRGALLPSMILSKEIQENSSTGFVTPFALFRIKRNDHRKQADMEYVLDLKKSFFHWEDLQGKDLIFADPMNATGGSLVTIVKFLKDQNIKPKSIKFFNVISALQGSLNIMRALDDVTIYTLWMDPVLNDKAYIMPGLGDAGDRLNGLDTEDTPRNMIQLLGDYGPNILGLYRSQVRKIEETILG